MKHIFGRPLTLALLSTAIAIVFSIMFVLIGVQVLGESEVLDELSCRLGFSDDCLYSELEEEKAKLAAVQERTKELEALYERLARLDYASESFVVFYNDRNGPEVVTGHEYKSLIEPGQFSSGWCYISSRSGGLQRNLTLATMNAEHVLEQADLDAADASSIGLSLSAARAAANRCRWPE